MTSRERLLATIQHKEPDVVPNSPRIHAFLRKYYGCCCWMHHLKAAKEFDFDPIIQIGPFIPNYVTSPFGTYEELEEVSVDLEVKQFPKYTNIRRTIHTPKGSLCDEIKQFKRGIEYGIAPNPLRVKRLVKNSEDIKKIPYLLPDPSKMNLDDIKRITEIVGNQGLVEVVVYSALDIKAGDAYGLDNMMLAYHDNKDLLMQLLRVFQDQVLAETEAYLEAGANVIYVSWYYASLSAGWSPRIYKEVFVPLIKEHVDLVHKYKGIYHFYDDGKCMPIIETLKGLGVDILSTLAPPPMGDVDLLEVKKKIGDRVCLKGNIDLIYTLMKGTPERIEEIVKETIETAAPEGGFILSTSDSIRDETPIGNVRAYFEAAREYGKYPIR